MDTNKTFYFVYLRLFFLLTFDFGAKWTRIRPFISSICGSFSYSLLISALCRTVYPLWYFIRVHSRPFVVKQFGLFLTNRCLALSSP